MTTAHMTIHDTAPSECTQACIWRLMDLSIRELVRMFDEKTKLFCFKLNGTSGELVREGQSARYTAITLMGLHRLEQRGLQSPIEIMPALEGLLRNTEWVNNIGDLGLLVWLCALVAPERLEHVDERLGTRNAMQRYADAQRGQTMELSWLLTALCYWGLARPAELSGLKQLVVEVYSRLIANQGKHGIFGHAARSGSLAGRTRGWIGSFADQVYPIYAMATFAKAYGEQEAEARALQCAHAICESQGNQGQWWWHYDSSTGHVIDGYPVFSVHQHGMAPMALFTLGELTGKDFRSWIYHGLAWINGKNELEFDMENAAASVVWRCIARSSTQFKRYLNAAFELETAKVVESAKHLKVLYECRPYELGWLLYAFAGRVEHQE